ELRGKWGSERFPVRRHAGRHAESLHELEEALGRGRVRLLGLERCTGSRGVHGVVRCGMESVVDQVIARSTRGKYGKNACIRTGDTHCTPGRDHCALHTQELVSISVPAELKATPAPGVLDD